MKRSKLNELKNRVSTAKEKQSDFEVICEKIKELPPGQLKKILTDDIIEIFKKNGVDI